MWYSRILLITPLVFLMAAYVMVEKQLKYILYLPINIASLFLYFKIRNCVNNGNFGVEIKTLSRIIKFGVGLLLLYTTVSLTTVVFVYALLIWGSILMTIDLVRAYFYEVSQKSFENKILTGYFTDILKLEKYIIYCVEGPAFVDLGRDLSIDEYFSRGRPKPIVIDELFSLWNDQNPYTECSSESEVDVQENKRIRKKWRVSINPETYEFKGKKSRPFWDLQDMPELDITRKEMEREKTFVMDPNEVISEGEIDYHEDIDDVSLSNRKWDFLETGKDKVKKIPGRPGLITVESLRVHFGEKHAREVHNLIAFKRCESISYDVFKENGRQINNERDSLYRTIQDNRNLLSIIRFILILIECVLSYFMIVTYLEARPLLLELMIPVIVVPALPIITVTLESFLFIVYTHPYDPGDRVHIEGENMVVREISLFYTTLERWDGIAVTIANLVIKDKAILNIRRSKSQQMKLDILVSSKTSEKKIELLREAVKKFVKNHGVYVTASVNIMEIIDSSHVRLEIIVKHAMNFQSGFFMWTNHTKFINMIISAMRTLNIKFKPVDMEVIDLTNSVKVN